MFANIRRFLELELQSVAEERQKFEQCNATFQPEESLNPSSSTLATANNVGYKEKTVLEANEIEDDNDDENQSPNKQASNGRGSVANKKSPLVEQLDLSSVQSCFNRNKELFIDKLIHSENPFTVRSDDCRLHAMLRYGDYSPNNPEFHVKSAPYLGLGEYEQRKYIVRRKLRDDYKKHVQNVQQYELYPDEKKSALEEADEPGAQVFKAGKENQGMHRNRSLLSGSRLDNRYNTYAIKTNNMDNKPKSILTNRKSDSATTSDRHFVSDLRHGYSTSFLDGFSYKDEDEELERVRLKRELYQAELRNQIEEKRHLAALRKEQEFREQELENRRLEQQLLRMQEEQLRDEQRRSRRDESFRKLNDGYLSHAGVSNSSNSGAYRTSLDTSDAFFSIRNTNVASKKQSSHFSPPVARRNPHAFNQYPAAAASVVSEPATSRYSPIRYDYLSARKDLLNRIDSINNSNSINNSVRCDATTRLNPSLGRYDSLSRIDSLNRQEALSRLDTLSIKDNFNRLQQRRHSATQQDLTMSSSTRRRSSPKTQRRSSSVSRYGGETADALPLPFLKVHSPVAKELKNSIAVSSSSSNRLDDRWQIPALQRNLSNHNDGSLSNDRQGRSILTQLGTIRMHLQQEQLRMDEEMRRRGFPTV